MAREVQEETRLSVRVERLLLDVPAEPPDGTYTQWCTYLCSVLGGRAAPGAGEGANADIVDVIWLPLRDERDWPHDVRTDAFLYPQLQAIKAATTSHAGAEPWKTEQ